MHRPEPNPQRHLPSSSLYLSPYPEAILDKRKRKMSLLQLPLSQFKALSLCSPFLHGSPLLRKPSLSPPTPSSSISLPPVRAVRFIQGRVVCATNDKTVSVEVVRLAPHPKYKRRIRHKKKYQAHDPDNQFKVGDVVQLQKCRPISKTKTFLAISAPSKRLKKPKEAAELQLPLESQQS